MSPKADFHSRIIFRLTAAVLPGSAEPYLTVISFAGFENLYAEKILQIIGAVFSSKNKIFDA